MRISNCRIVGFPKIEDHRGNLTFIENSRHIPFDVKRIYYVYDVPGGSERAGHAHKQLEQVFIAMSGSFDVTLDDGYTQTKFHMNRSYYGLYVCSMVWRKIDNFSSGSVLLVLASDFYEEADYYRDWNDFVKAARG